MMERIVLDGFGLLSGPLRTAEECRSIKEQEARAEQAARQHEAEQAAIRKETEQTFWPLLCDEAQAEIAAAKLSPATIKKYAKAFDRFKENCASVGLDYLPASPHAVLIFLAGETQRGVKHLLFLCEAIARAHRVADAPDPTKDILVRVLIRTIRNNKKRKESH